MSPSSSSFVQTNRDFAATNEEEDDDDASNNWMRLINNRRDREKIARLRDADDPSLRAMFDAITTTLKQKDENVERAAAIGFERGVSFAAGPSSSSSFVNNATKKKKTKNGTKRLENDSDSDDDSSDDDDDEEEEEEEEEENRNKIERRSKASSAAGTLLVSDEEDVAEEDRMGRNDTARIRASDENKKSKDDDVTALRWVVERKSYEENDEMQKSILNDLEVVDLRRKLANAQSTTNNAVLSKMLATWRLACFTTRRNESVAQRMRVVSEHRRLRSAFRSWMDASLEYKRRRVLIGVRDADGGDRKKNNKGSDLSGTTGSVDDEEEEEFAPDYSEECERLQLEVKSLREMLERERTKPLSGPGAEFKEQANAFNAHLKKVVRDLEATRSLNAQLTRRLEIREKQLHGYQGGGNEYADNAMKPTNRANQRTMGTQTTFETHPGSQHNSRHPKLVSLKNEREQSFVKDSAPGNRYEYVKAENEKLRQELEKQTKILHEKFEMQLRAAEVAERKLNDERQKRAREIELREKASNDLKREHEREMMEMIESYDALYGRRDNNNKSNDSELDTASKPSPPKKMSATSSMMKKRRDEIVSSLRSPQNARVRDDIYRDAKKMQQQQYNNNDDDDNNTSDKLSSILSPRERTSLLSPEKGDAMTFEKMASIHEDYVKQPHHRTTSRPQREKSSPPPNNFAMLRPSTANNADEYEDAGDMILSPTKTFSESNPAAANSSPRSKVTPKGFTPRGEQLTLSAFNEYANVGKKQSRTMGTSMRNDEFDDIDGNDEDEDVNNKNSKKKGQDLVSSLPSRLFSPSANEMNKSASEDDYVDDDDDDQEGRRADDEDDDDWGLALPRKPHHLTTSGSKKNVISRDELELSRSDWDDLLSKRNSHQKGDGASTARKGARKDLRLSESRQRNNAPPPTTTKKTKTMVIAELVIRGWSKNEASFALDKVGENDVNKCAEWLIRRNH